MKFDIPKITRCIRLSEYAQEYGELEIRVWVNPPARLLEEHDQVVNDVSELSKEMVQAGLRGEAGNEKKYKARLEDAADRLVKVFYELWSQGPVDTRWTEEEVRKLTEETAETDPQLWPWLRNRSIDEIRAHRSGVKKN